MAEMCKHSQKINNEGIIICEECGQQLDEHLLEEQYYHSATNNPRHNMRREVERSLYPDLIAKGFPQNIIERANIYYTRMIEDSIYRSRNRISIVFVSVLRAYEDIGEPVNANELAKRFDLDKKGVSKGLLLFSSIFKNELSKNHIKPIDLAPRILSDIGIKDYGVYINDLKMIYRIASENSMDIKKAIPQTVAAGLVFYYLRLKNHPIAKSDYAKIVKLTEITFTNVALEFCKSLDCPVKLN